ALVKARLSAFRHDEAEVPVAAAVEDRDLLAGRVAEDDELLSRGALEPQARLLDTHRLDRLPRRGGAHDPRAGAGRRGGLGPLLGRGTGLADRHAGSP